ncbi:copper-containing nitrite reductase [Halorubrum saccharovorum]|nr:copper-containing nitrite reductase [Halorubrum saccharovorum]
MSQDLSRRKMVAALGIGAVGAVAGCIGAPVNAETPPEDETERIAPELDPARDVGVDRIAADPTDVPAPVDWDEPREHDVTLRTKEVVAEVEPGVTFKYMTFEGQVPGPMIRVRRGDTVNLRFEVPNDDNSDIHNVDFHAVYGPGGGAVDTTLVPGDDAAELSFRAEFPGLFTYHCAVPAMDHHVSSGMFGAILVEPEAGLPAVDREVYLGQHELYTTGDLGEKGHHAFDHGAMLAEDPTYVVFNGEHHGFTKGRRGAIGARVGETVRVFFVNGGPNQSSSWHPIGNVWSRLYRDGDLVSDPARYVETTPVAPGTATVGEMELPVPGPIKVVDHALSRAGRRGALAVVNVDGEPNPDVYEPGTEQSA